MPYGKVEELEILLRDMKAQKHFLKCYKDGECKGHYIEGQIRILPFGIYEYVFPKEDLDMVLHTLDFDSKGVYNIPEIFLKIIRQALRLKKAPEYKKEKYFLWIRQNVSIIPIGIREDQDIVDKTGEFDGWRHEGI
jgi:hypothetical protein